MCVAPVALSFAPDGRKAAEPLGFWLRRVRTWRRTQGSHLAVAVGPSVSRRIPGLSSPRGCEPGRRTRCTLRTKFAPPGASAGNASPEEEPMSRDRVSRRCRRLLERLSQPSSAAGLAALLALVVPQLAEHAPAIVDLALTVIAIGAAIVAMVRCECRDCNGR